MIHVKLFEQYKEEVLGEITTDVAAITVTSPDGNDKVERSTGADGTYKVIARWNDFKEGDISQNVPDEIVIKIRD